MKRKRYRRGQEVSDFLVFYKEAYPRFTSSGSKKIRMCFFQCRDHEDNFFLMSLDGALRNRRHCPCESKFNGEEVNKVYSRMYVDSYSFTEKLRKHEAAMSISPPGWFYVTRMGAFLKGRDRNHLFYKFEKTNRTGADYRCARRIEDITWNRPKKNRAFYLMRMSHELDALHMEGVIKFNSTMWNRGANLKTFEEICERII